MTDFKNENNVEIGHYGQTLINIVRWCKGSTTDFDSVSPGSNPGRTTFLRGVLKIRFFEADEILKPEFTVVNEDFKIEVQQRKSNF